MPRRNPCVYYGMRVFDGLPGGQIPYTCVGSRSARSYKCENSVGLADLLYLANWAWQFCSR